MHSLLLFHFFRFLLIDLFTQMVCRQALRRKKKRFFVCLWSQGYSTIGKKLVVVVRTELSWCVELIVEKMRRRHNGHAGEASDRRRRVKERENNGCSSPCSALFFCFSYQWVWLSAWLTTLGAGASPCFFLKKNKK